MNEVAAKFEAITRNIWANINLSDNYRLLHGEETITDSILLELAKQNFFNIKVIQTPKHLEAIQGTDWEWYVGSETKGWIRYVIQAKKLDTKSKSYKKLNHKIARPPINSYQIDLLRKFSKANGAVPLYTFYNYFPKANKADHWQCNRAFDKELLGWTFTTLKNIEAAVKIRGSRTFDKIHRLTHTLPIRCLFSCPYFESLYQNQALINSTADFLGESFRKVAKLPTQFIEARETGILKEFPDNLYNYQIELFPKRIAIIDLSDNIVVAST